VQLAVRLKEGLLDPQGKAVEGALPSLGWDNVSRVRVGKDIELEIEAADEAAARSQVQEMAVRFLTNPVIEDFSVVEVAPAASVAGNGAAR
jgi:phosphoribosylformylglycinamidine synthase